MIELVKKEKLKGIWVGDMKDGDVGVIVAWPPMSCYLDKIVQRHKNKLINIGNSDWWHSCCVIPKNCRVRLLEKGETLIVT